VHLKVVRTADRLAIEVGDEGDGFDQNEVPDPLAGENLLRGSGRGVMLMKSFMDEFQISQRQPQGTEVKMVKYKAKAT
jgi:serine/threonine-protein kinase RsbW